MIFLIRVITNIKYLGLFFKDFFRFFNICINFVFYSLTLSIFDHTKKIFSNILQTCL